MEAKLELNAMQYGWSCTNCHQFFDAFWRPAKKGWKPPEAYMWMADKPDFNYCPYCGAKFMKPERR